MTSKMYVTEAFIILEFHIKSSLKKKKIKRQATSQAT